MKHVLPLTLTLSASLLASSLSSAALAQTRTPQEVGKREFEAHCATCHGIDARGDGPMRPFLARAPSNLTTIARRHGGNFPRSAIADMIDGRGLEGPGPHGTRDMPIWGQVYRDESDMQLRGTPFPAEWSVRGRILSLVEYLSTIQLR